MTRGNSFTFGRLDVILERLRQGTWTFGVTAVGVSDKFASQPCSNGHIPLRCGVVKTSVRGGVILADLFMGVCMHRRGVAAVLVTLLCCSVALYGQQEPKGVNAESETWYEFDQKVFSKLYKMYAFKTDEQRNNRARSILIRKGWGVTPQEPTEQFFALRRYEKTRVYDELKSTMAKDGYKWAFTIYRTESVEHGTVIHLDTFLYDADKDILYLQKWSK